MSVELPVEAQFNAYNAHDLEAFLACFAEAGWTPRFYSGGLSEHVLTATFGILF